MAVVSAERDLVTYETTTVARARYEWLDEMRGMVALLFMVSVLTNAFGGDPVLGEKPLGPTYLNHGFEYFKGYPALITIVDVGQAMFLFILGLAGFIAFSRRLRTSKGQCVGYAARRVVLLYALSFLDCGGLDWLFGKGFNLQINQFLYTGTLAQLALAALTVYTCVFFIRGADRRFLVALGIMIGHAILYAFHLFSRYEYLDDAMNLPQIPFGTINLAAVALAGSAFAQWLQRDPENLHAGLKERVLPVSVACLMASYCMEWLQPSEHHDTTTALALLAIGLSGFGMCAAYGLELIELQIPLLGALGRNLILIFLVSSIGVDRYVRLLPEARLATMPYATVLCVVILPMLLITGVVVILDKRRIWIRL